jgi:hypothetical protein
VSANLVKSGSVVTLLMHPSEGDLPRRVPASGITKYPITNMLERFEALGGEITINIFRTNSEWRLS